ncbi:unnamed protein product [Thelazia callipaeda]|uniref:Outer membrane protein n=1 Tax=Thelazia callipaeda TaxID=103827 RepID=A0A0N5DC32_THECL|nr:unnamed protein product [Thelazia callipaeda]
MLATVNPYSNGSASVNNHIMTITDVTDQVGISSKFAN